MGRSPSLCAMTTTPPARAPIVERVAGWSARHRKTAVFGWLLLVVAAVVIGQLPDSESVLVQGRSAGQTYGNDPEIREAVRQVVAGLRALPKSAAGIQSPLSHPGLVSGRSALVTFNVADNPGNDD